MAKNLLGKKLKLSLKVENDFNRKLRNKTPPKYRFHQVIVEHIIDGKSKKF